MVTRLSSHSLALIMLSLILAVLLPGSPSATTSAAILQSEPTPLEATVVSALTSKVYLPYVEKGIEKEEWVEVSLRNGNFEVLWEIEPSNAVLIFHTSGYIEHAIRGNIRTPPGWVTWFRHGYSPEQEPHNPDGWEWSQPEVTYSEYKKPDRMRSGANGLRLFTFWRIHDGGFFQRVEAQPGQNLHLSGWAHAWSNAGLHSVHPHDPEWSEGVNVGYNHFFAAEGTPNLDPGDRNFTFWLGIDPTGGTNPYAKSVVWGRGAHIYNAFRPVPSVSVVAEARTVTVFLRSRTLVPFQHNDAYWDDIVLQALR
jgi:hypothetical protein